jgi:hypothetical protein
MTTLDVLRVRRRRRRQTTESHPIAQEPLLLLVALLTLLLVWVLLGPGWAILVASMVALWAGLALRARGGSHTLHPTRRHHQAPDYEKRVLRTGLLTLLLGAVLLLLFSVPRERFQEWSAAAATPKPADCDWTSPPLGDKHCHYDASYTHVNDRQGDHVTVQWHRVYDY